MHGHTWEITAWWAGTPNALEKQAQLNLWLSSFDHGFLPDILAWGESLAARIAKDLGCCRVDVSRPLERIYAIVERIDHA
ncbi:hypothetical protein [uncultured Novosphingobium sp.]|uniref:hypothetical protein n=1 Tax=uncultured Novosphingobium sp. TaxID=292277 RepID=UPI00259A9B85|nr:hypothetical protein [uncultured Novosphingobium sp.]